MDGILRIITNPDGSIRIDLIKAIDIEIMQIHDNLVRNPVADETVGQFKIRLLEQFGIIQPENSVLLLDFFNFNEVLNISDILKRVVNTGYTFYNPVNYIFLSPTTTDAGGAGSHDERKVNFMENLIFPTDLNQIFTFNSKQYKLIGIIWHGGDTIKSGHYVAEINIINPYHGETPGLYFCNDIATFKIDNWNSEKISELANPTPHLFIFESVVPSSGGSRHPLTKHNQKNKSKNKSKNKTRRIGN
jgi:hypothetical protein